MRRFSIIILNLITFSFFTMVAVADTDPHVAYSMMNEGRGIIFDVREVDELGPGMIDGAFWFALSKIKNNENWKNELLDQTKGKKIFLYCRTGRRSEEVKNILMKNGIYSENIGGFEELKEILPVKKPY